jgi:hypothetical protein
MICLDRRFQPVVFFVLDRSPRPRCAVLKFPICFSVFMFLNYVIGYASIRRLLASRIVFAVILLERMGEFG